MILYSMLNTNKRFAKQLVGVFVPLLFFYLVRVIRNAESFDLNGVAATLWVGTLIFVGYLLALGSVVWLSEFIGWILSDTKLNRLVRNWGMYLTQVAFFGGVVVGGALWAFGFVAPDLTQMFSPLQFTIS